MATTMHTETRRRPDGQCIARWRFSRLRRAGDGPRAAATLASRPNVDLHLAVELLERGCTVETALAILALTRLRP